MVTTVRDRIPVRIRRWEENCTANRQVDVWIAIVSYIVVCRLFLLKRHVSKGVKKFSKRRPRVPVREEPQRGFCAFRSPISMYGSGNWSISASNRAGRLEIRRDIKWAKRYYLGKYYSNCNSLEDSVWNESIICYGFPCDNRPTMQGVCAAISVLSKCHIIIQEVHASSI